MTAMSDDDKIKRLPVSFKAPPGEIRKALQVIESYASHGGCNHRWFFREDVMIDVTYFIREGETEVECGNCHAKLDPMWVLRLLATEESQWERARSRYHEEMKRLSERSRTKCDHYGRRSTKAHQGDRLGGSGFA